jgi:pimeloyl-ACP methyl ester carboxylesterase
MPLFLKDSKSLYYEDHGQGEVLVLLNGFGRSMRHWLGFDQLLAKNNRVITIDHRGVGRSSATPVSWKVTMFDYADDVAAILEHLHIKGAHIVGLSMGGMIAMAFGLRHAKLTKSLVVINSSIAGQKSLQVGIAGIKLFSTIIKNRDQFNYIVGPLLLSSQYKNPKKLFDIWHTFQSLEPFNADMAVKQFLAIKRFKAGGSLKRLEVPTLILKGSDDRLVPTTNSDILHNLIPTSQLVEIADGGHEMTVDHRMEVCEAVEVFVEDVVAAAEVKKQKVA